jgi:outer membrane protein OmpA-like peptidoglycan-associated protein
MNTNNFTQNMTMMRKLIFTSVLLLAVFSISVAQEAQRTQPKFWVGISGAANINMYTGTTQTLHSSLMAPAAFHDGFGLGGFGSLLLEYRPIPVIGIMLNLGYDNRGGSFDQVMSPCNCPEDLKTNLSYATIQPSIRISPFGPNFYVFLGGAYGYNIDKSFAYTFDQNTGSTLNASEGNFSDILRDVFSTHIGFGYDIQLAAVNSPNQVALSPFVSYHPYFGQAPRNIESWSLSTVRVGLALKFGKGKVNEPIKDETIIAAKTEDKIIPVIVTNNTKFTVTAPVAVPVNRTINEAFPLRNYIFFEKESSKIPKRYVQLNATQAVKFKPEQLQVTDPIDQTGRSTRQMKAYYNILNILAYRMHENPTSTITLAGASAGDGEALGEEYAKSVKRYLVDVFGISGDRVLTKGRNRPLYPSELPGGKNYLVLLREGDRRVDITCNPVSLMDPLQIIVKQTDPLDGRVLVNVDSDDEVPFKSWVVDVTDENGVSKQFGPYTRKQESISVNTILGNNSKGKYKIVFTGTTANGETVKQESVINLIKNEAPKEESLRFSILYDFDKSEAIANYERFLVNKVTPHIVNNSMVIIHGHTDIIGSTEYNMQLSQRRASDTREILEKAVYAAGKTGVRFDVIAFGMDAVNAPFENKLPEERFYNRTVIIDIIQPQ